MAIQAMNTAIKNNNLMRSKRERFKKTLGGYGKNTKTEYNLPKANPRMLKNIRKKLKKENQIVWLKVIFGSAIVIMVLVYFLLSL